VKKTTSTTKSSSIKQPTPKKRKQRG
jgi:hypothetical protein